MTVRWNRPKDGYVSSKCGRFLIAPLFCGTTRPQFYELRDAQTGKALSGFNSTIREAKDDAAERIKPETEEK